MGYFRLRQVCLAAPHVEACTQLVQALLGLSECHRDPNVAKYGLENILFPLGNRFLEIVCPVEHGRGTPAGRFLEASGGRGGYMLIFDCDDPASKAERAQAKGVRLANHIDRETFQGYQLHPRDCRACFLEFDRTRGGEDPDAAYWPAGDRWQDHVRTDVVRGFDGVEVLSPDAPDLARHWSVLLEIEAEVRDGAFVFAVDEQRIAILPAPGIERERLDALQLSVRDAAGIIARARFLGLETQEDGFLLAGVRFRLSEAPA